MRRMEYNKKHSNIVIIVIWQLGDLNYDLFVVIISVHFS